MSAIEWYPIVYGRTRRADRWWRALPDEPHPDWIKSVVRATISGGRGLPYGPRFVLSQDGRHRLVGVACQAAELSATMNSDGQRDLYCFVGWVGAQHLMQPPRGASLQALERHYVQWASPVYEEWMARDWDLHESQVGEPRRPDPGEPPWRPEDETPLQELRWQFDPAAAYAWPMSQRVVPWDLARADRRPVTVIVGFSSARDVPAEPSMLIAAADVGSPMPLEVHASSAPPSPARFPVTPPPRSSPMDPRRVQGSAEPPAPTADPWALAKRRIPPATLAAEPPASEPPAPKDSIISKIRNALSRLAGPEPDDEPPEDTRAARSGHIPERAPARNSAQAPPRNPVTVDEEARLAAVEESWRADVRASEARRPEEAASRMDTSDTPPETDGGDAPKG